MAESLDAPGFWVSTTSNLSGGGTVVFDTPDTSQSDAPPTDPITFWLRVLPTASETAPD